MQSLPNRPPPAAPARRIGHEARNRWVSNNSVGVWGVGSGRLGCGYRPSVRPAVLPRRSTELGSRRATEHEFRALGLGRLPQLSRRPYRCGRRGHRLCLAISHRADSPAGPPKPMGHRRPAALRGPQSSAARHSAAASKTSPTEYCLLPSEYRLLELVDGVVATFQTQPTQLQQHGTRRGMDEVVSQRDLHDRPRALGDGDQSRRIGA